MKLFIRDVYQLLYKMTGMKSLSLWTSLMYVTILNLITIRGVGMLLEDLMPSILILHTFFIFPFLLITTLVMLFINFVSILPLKSFYKDKRKPLIIPIIVYTVASLLLLIYICNTNDIVA